MIYTIKARLNDNEHKFYPFTSGHKLLNKFIALLLYNTFQNGYFFIEKSSLAKFSEILDPNLGKY